MHLPSVPRVYPSSHLAQAEALEQATQFSMALAPLVQVVSASQVLVPNLYPEAHLSQPVVALHSSQLVMHFTAHPASVRPPYPGLHFEQTFTAEQVWQFVIVLSQVTPPDVGHLVPEFVGEAAPHLRQTELLLHKVHPVIVEAQLVSATQAPAVSVYPVSQLVQAVLALLQARQPSPRVQASEHAEANPYFPSLHTVQVPALHVLQFVRDVHNDGGVHEEAKAVPSLHFKQVPVVPHKPQAVVAHATQAEPGEAPK